MTSQPKVYIVILNWNGWRDTLECLESVGRLDYENYRVVVCDNNSADDSYQQIVNWCEGNLPAPASKIPAMAKLTQPSISKPVALTQLDREGAERAVNCLTSVPMVLIQTGANLGFAGGNNVGIRYAMNQGDCDFIWLLNNDTVVEPDALIQLVTHSTDLRAAGTPNTCGSLVCFYDDPNVIQALGGNTFNLFTGVASQSLGRFLPRDTPIKHQEYADKLDYVSGCSWLVPIEFLETVGLMEEGYFLYYEEIDWAMRARGKFALTYAPGSIVYHKEGSSIGSKSINRGASPFSEFYMARSRLKFMKQFGRRHLPIVYLTMLLQVANRLRRRQWKNAMAFTRALLGRQQFRA